MSVREAARALSPTSVDNVQRQKSRDHTTKTKKNFAGASAKPYITEGESHLLILCTNTLPDPYAAKKPSGPPDYAM